MTRLNALQPVGLLFLRLALGIIFIWHGYPKLTHANAMQGLFVQHRLPGYFVTVAGVLEVFGGALIILGFLTRIAALLLAMEMAVAIWKVHSAGGYMAVHSYEFPLVLAAASFALATIGAGRASVDYALYESGGARPPRPGKPKGKP
jgi:putative oxidoreductase